ncbi:MAG: acylphosphatase [Terriglobia bacterium]
MLAAKRYLISGRVQGVGFRFFAEREANRLGLRGYVRNLSDGRVEAYAVGEPGFLNSFRGRLAEGPRAAKVVQIDESDQPVNRQCTSFRIEG